MLSNIHVKITNNSASPMTVPLFTKNWLPPNKVTVSVFGGYSALLNEITKPICVDGIKYTTQSDTQKQQEITFAQIDSSGHSQSNTVVPSTYISAQQPNDDVINIPGRILLDGKHPVAMVIEPETTVSLTLYKCRSRFASFMMGIIRRKIRRSPAKCRRCV